MRWRTFLPNFISIRFECMEPYVFFFKNKKNKKKGNNNKLSSDMWSMHWKTLKLVVNAVEVKPTTGGWHVASHIFAIWGDLEVKKLEVSCMPQHPVARCHAWEMRWSLTGGSVLFSVWAWRRAGHACPSTERIKGLGQRSCTVSSTAISWRHHSVSVTSNSASTYETRCWLIQSQTSFIRIRTATAADAAALVRRVPRNF